MAWAPSQIRRSDGRQTSKPVRPALENLETRLALSTAGSTADAIVALPHHAHVLSAGHVHEVRQSPILGTISGQITKASNGKGLGRVRVELIDANGNVVEKTFTNGAGKYSFRVRQNGAYVVHEVAPRNYRQTSPTFSTAAPTGSYASSYGGKSWNYRTGNTDPTLGPVGPSSWATIAPEGALPFESPINIQGPAVDLGQVLKVNYNNAVPKQIINNGAQLQVQFPSNGADTITLAGQQYNLAQFHYHDPSENQVGGRTYPMEEHFVNVSASGAETVLAVFLQLGAHNGALDPILAAAQANLTSPNTSTTIATQINFAGLLPSSMQGWFYEGSLTTPPLSQVVNWLVFSTPITLDEAQLQQYEAVANGSGFLPNARPIQPTDGRQMNEFNYDVNFQGQSIAGLNFTVDRGTSIARAASVGGRSRQAAIVGVESVSPTSVTSTAQALAPVSGCNCPLCQALRNADWHQVNVASIAPAPIVVTG